MVNPQQPASYPTSGGESSTGRGARMKPPGPVNGAFFIYLIVAILSALSIVLVLTSSVWDQAIQNSGTSEADTRALVSAAKVVTVVIGVIFLALYLLFAFKMRAGRNWARIVLTVLSALSVVSSFSSSSSVNINGQVFRSSSSLATGWIGVALAVVAIVLMYLKASSLYFTASKRANLR